MNYIILSNFFVLAILTYLGAAFLPFRYNEISKRIIVFSLSFIFMTLVNYNGASSSKAIFILIIMSFNLVGIFKTSLPKILFVLFPFYIIITVSEILTASIFNLLFDFNEYTQSTKIEYLFALCISNFTAFILSKSYIKFKKIFEYSDLPKYAWLIFILPVTTIIYMVSIEDYYEIYRHNISLLFILIGLFISNLVIIYIFLKVTEIVHLKNEMNLLQIKEQMAKQQLNSLDQFYKDNFDFLHDFLNQCQHFDQLIEDHNINKLKTEINDLADLVYHKFNYLYSNSAVLNTVLNARKELITKQNIHINTTMEHTDFNFIPLNEQIELFSYLLDIGIDHTKLNNDDNRWIIIKSLKQKNQLIITEKFSCKNIAYEVKCQIKKELQHLLMKYHAFVSVEHLEDNKLTSIIILFKG